MIPSAWVLLDALPLTPNGKVDRRALPAPAGVRPDLGAVYVAPRTALEEVLAGIWGGGPRSERGGGQDNFLPLGRPSLLATHEVSPIREALGGSWRGRRPWCSRCGGCRTRRWTPC